MDPKSTRLFKNYGGITEIHRPGYFRNIALTEHYEDEKVPMSVLIQDILMFYKYGGKQLYYNNTYDGQGETDINKKEVEQPNVPYPTEIIDDEDCESCKI